MWTISDRQQLGGVFTLPRSPPFPHSPFEGDSAAMMRKGPAGSTPQQGQEYTARETSVPRVSSSLYLLLGSLSGRVKSTALPPITLPFPTSSPQPNRETRLDGETFSPACRTMTDD